MTAEFLLFLTGVLLLVSGIAVYLKAQRLLTPDDKKILDSALANPSPITTACYVAFLIGSMGLLVVTAVITGRITEVLYLAPPSVCIASFVKSYIGVKPLKLDVAWKQRFLIGLALTCLGISIGFAAAVSCVTDFTVLPPKLHRRSV